MLQIAEKLTKLDVIVFGLGEIANRTGCETSNSNDESLDYLWTLFFLFRIHWILRKLKLFECRHCKTKQLNLSEKNCEKSAAKIFEQCQNEFDIRS